MNQIMEEESVKLIDEGALAEIVINRPKALNALNADVLASLIMVLEKLAKSTTLRAVIVTGAGDKAFVAGADIHSMNQLGVRAAADYIELGQRAMRCLERMEVPVIAALNGFALGGGLELALACDIIIAAKTAKLGQPEVNLGIIPGFGGTQRLIQRCGIGTARRLIYSGELIEAEEGRMLGLVDKVCDPADLRKEVRALAETISKKGPLAVKMAKQVITRSQEGSLLSGLKLEIEGFLELFASADREEGMTAFMQKREAKFTGR